MKTGRKNSARRNGLLAKVSYIDIAAPHCVYCHQSGKLGLDHVPAISRTNKPSKFWPGLFTYPACTACNISLRHFEAVCLKERAREIHARALRNTAGGEKGERAKQRALNTQWATALDARSPDCMCRLCRD